MYKYTSKALIVNFVFVGLLIFSIVFIDISWAYKLLFGFVAIIILRDAFKEKNASFELTGDKMLVKSKEKVVKEIKYRDMKYLTITRRNKKWVVIADDERVIFTIKPRITNYENLIAELIEKNKSNKKLEVHDFIKKTYKK